MLSCRKKINHFKTWAVVSAAIFLSHAAWAAESAIAKVNGQPIGGELLSFLVEANVARGLKDSPEMRNALKNELVSREVLIQEAQRQKLDADPKFKMQLLMQKNSLLVDGLLAKHFEKFVVSEDKLRAEYKRQSDLLSDTQQYKLGHIVVSTEADAKAIIKTLGSNNAADFSQLAREKSTHPSAQNGGDLGWLLPNQIAPALVNVVVNLAVGGITALPIATPEGWQVIKLEEKRPFKVPSYEDSKQQLVNAVLAAERSAYIQSLLKAAKIE